MLPSFPPPHKCRKKCNERNKDKKRVQYINGFVVSALFVKRNTQNFLCFPRSKSLSFFVVSLFTPIKIIVISISPMRFLAKIFVLLC